MFLVALLLSVLLHGAAPTSSPVLAPVAVASPAPAPSPTDVLGGGPSKTCPPEGCPLP